MEAKKSRTRYPRFNSDRQRFEYIGARPARGGCELWNGRVDKNGRAIYDLIGGGVMSAQRMAYIVAFGAVPDSHQVRRTCQSRECVAEAHLRLSIPNSTSRSELVARAISAEQQVSTWKLRAEKLNKWNSELLESLEVAKAEIAELEKQLEAASAGQS